MNAAFTSEYLFTYTCSKSWFELPPRVFFPPRDIGPWCPLLRPASHAGPCSTLSVSHTLGGLLHHGLCRLYHPAAASGIFTSGVFPAAQLSRLSTIRTLLSFWPALLPAISRWRRSVRPSPSGSCAGQRSVAIDRSADSCRRPIPSCVFSFLGPFSARLGDAFAPPPLMAFATWCSCPPSRWPPAYPSMCGLSFYL